MKVHHTAVYKIHHLLEIFLKKSWGDTPKLPIQKRCKISILTNKFCYTETPVVIENHLENSLKGLGKSGNSRRFHEGKTVGTLLNSMMKYLKTVSWQIFLPIWTSALICKHDQTGTIQCWNLQITKPAMGTGISLNWSLISMTH